METKQLLNELTQKLADSKIIFQIIDQVCYLIYWEWKVKVENGIETKTGREIKIKIGDLSLTLEYYWKKWMEEIKESLKNDKPSTQMLAFMNIPESEKTQKNQRPNEHRAWFMDQSVINFLWAKGWACCQAEACDWWHYVNENLKKDLFTSEQEWKDFKEKGVLPTKHKENWAKLSPKQKAEIEKECWNSGKNQWYPEKFLTYTLKKVNQQNHEKP